MLDFLIFKTFISRVALIVFYYISAIIMPIFIWFSSRYIMKRFDFIEKSYQTTKDIVWKNSSLKYKILFFTIFIMMFIFMELLLRMAFEFLIAYIQIRDALVT